MKDFLNHIFMNFMSFMVKYFLSKTQEASWEVLLNPILTTNKTLL